ncbi:MAG: CPBP family intramembrane metalloprotease, partial [Clostridia bacterium]|nr:CPBP family intramembrane metalloprotease [Clostridia bacterium]
PPEKGFTFAFWKNGTATYLLLFCPFFLSVWALGYITGILGGFFGLENTIDTSGSPLSLFVSQVLLAAFAEELTFRFVFLRYLAPYHKGAAVLISAATFALMHVQILQLPYAFLAGAMLAALTLVTESPLPAFLFHLANNAAHLSAAICGDFILLFTILLCAVGTAVCLLWRKYREKTCEAALGCFPKSKEGAKDTLCTAFASPLSLLWAALLLLSILSLR